MPAAHAPIQYIMESAPEERADERVLRFTQNGTFQISVFEDLHFAESITLPSHWHIIAAEANLLTLSNYPDAARDSMTKAVMRSVLSNENAQLVVINGDLISGEFIHPSNAAQYLPQVISPLVDANQTWASTYGNHDSDTNLDPMKDIYELERQYPNSLTRSMLATSKAGITNYYLPVYSRSSNIPALILWFFDSKGGHYPIDGGTDPAGDTREDWVDESVREVMLS